MKQMAPALPIATSGPPLLRVVSPSALGQWERDTARANIAANQPLEPAMIELARYVRSQWDIMQRHRNNASGWSERLLHAQRTFNGQYDATQLAAIRQWGGSDIYARLTALKARGATALLREVYIGTGERPWGLDPTPQPKLPDDMLSAVSQLVQLEAQNVVGQGVPIDLSAIRDRTQALLAGVARATKKRARLEAKRSEDQLDDLLVEGGFYEALTFILTDITIFPFCCIKGPVVRIVPDIVWQNGQAATIMRPKLFWNRISPFDIFFTPGAQRIADADVIERQRLTRTDLNDLIGLPGYNEPEIRAVLDEYGASGYREPSDSTDSERARMESREDPTFNQSGLIDCLEFNGNVQGRPLLEYGLSPREVPDELRDYSVQVWLIGRHVIKAQITPNPRKRHPYYITSFEKVPGTIIGNALPDILADIQDVCNATLRALVNNQAMASGPQVVVDEERLSALDSTDEMYPWKRWRVKSDPLKPSNQADPPVNFFQPKSNAAELMGVYSFFQNMADEMSAIPRYITGSEKIGGAGRTASGLAMLMGNAAKVLQMVAANIDSDIISQSLQGLYDMIMITDKSGRFRGDEDIRVRGVEIAVQRETARQRQIELLQATMNPIDMQIMGLPGRAKLLRAVSQNVGLEDDIVPPEEEMMANASGVEGSPGAPGVPMPMDPAEVTPGVRPGANMALGQPEQAQTQGLSTLSPRSRAI